MVGCICRNLRIITLLIFVLIIVQAGRNITQHSRACRIATRSTTKHKLLIVEQALDNYTIKFILYTIDILITRNKLRHNAHNESITLNLLNVSNQFEATLLLVCKTDIIVIHIRYTVGKNLLWCDIQTKGVDGDDDKFEQRIPTVNIECRITLGKTQILSQLQCVGIRHLLIENLRQNEIRRAIQDTFNRSQKVVIVILLQVTNYRNTTASRSIVQQSHIVTSLQLYQLLDMAGKHLLITRHYGQTHLQCSLNDSICGIGIINQLNNKVNIRVIENIIGIICELCIHTSLLIQITHANTLNLHVLRADTLQHII